MLFQAIYANMAPTTCGTVWFKPVLALNSLRCKEAMAPKKAMTSMKAKGLEKPKGLERPKGLEKPKWKSPRKS